MSAYHRQKGSSFERMVADFLKANGFPFADRRVVLHPLLTSGIYKNAYGKSAPLRTVGAGNGRA